MLYRSILRPTLFKLPPETAHELALHALRTTLGPKTLRRIAEKRFATQSFGRLERFGLSFSSPVGLAAGFDKNGAALRELAALGFGFIEAGTVTNLKQPGNPKPRLFRLPKDRALINRQGFNNEGASALVERIKKGRPSCVLGVNIGKSRAVELEDSVADYLSSFETVQPHADYVAVNVSSPNTPSLRELQRADRLLELLSALQDKNRELSEKSARPPAPLLVKISPDVSEGDLEMIVDAALRAGVSGIIATNTTIGREGLKTGAESVRALGEGGLSGQPLRSRSTHVIAALHRLARGRLTIVGVGGIFSAQDAWEKITAGASLVQLYTGFVYRGFSIAREINDGLAALLSERGFRTLDDAVGSRAAEIVAG